MPDFRYVKNGTHKVLTKREEEVLLKIMEGKSNPQIASELVLSTHTAKVHVSAILQKLGAACKVDAAVEAFRRGWVEFYNNEEKMY